MDYKGDSVGIVDTWLCLWSTRHMQDGMCVLLVPSLDCAAGRA